MEPATYEIKKTLINPAAPYDPYVTLGSKRQRLKESAAVCEGSTRNFYDHECS
jgi:hypothetical protein